MTNILSKFKKWKSKKAAADLISIIISVVLIAALVLGILLFLSNKVRNTAMDEINNTMNTITGIAEANRNNTDIVVPGGPGGGPIIPPETKTIYYANINTGTVYDTMPATISDGDVYLKGDYIYVYIPSLLGTDGWSVFLAAKDTGALILQEIAGTDIVAIFPDYEWTDNNQLSYGAILESINGKDIVGMSYTFEGCTSLTDAPAIPSSVTSIDGTFGGCTSLTDVSDLVIPNSVTSMYGTFMGCTNLTKAPEIPNSVTDMAYTFCECAALEEAPILPNNVINIDDIFSLCTSLKTYVGSVDADGDFSNYILPQNITSMDSVFRLCEHLVKSPTIPNNVTRLNNTFNGTSLETFPIIPNGVTSFGYTFENCPNLTGEVEINASNLTFYDACFKGTVKPIKIVGSCSEMTKSRLAATATNGNVTY